MSEEIRVISDAKWPAGVRLPIALTFEIQAGEGAPRLPGDRPNFMVGGTLEYGARVGVWNILEVLDAARIKATFFVCGTTAEKYPDVARAIVGGGHEIAGMSYAFDRVRTMGREREAQIVRKSIETLQSITGAAITGWRCPDYRVSPQTLDVLSMHGLKWDSSLLNDDYPTLFRCSGGELVELPFTTSTADKTFIGYPYPQRGGPDGLANVWASEFEVLHREAHDAARFMILSNQAWATGRPAPLRTLRQFIERTITAPGARYATCSEIAAWSHPDTSGKPL